ncbi:MAG: hypothetical protein CFK48_06245 [Armatimonadetes bacterium CP1_7O]|nr:MAG: hypothetical protein CFK48_06245 [Armatimonadetes bacterium CP1_7O]
MSGTIKGIRFLVQVVSFLTQSRSLLKCPQSTSLPTKWKNSQKISRGAISGYRQWRTMKMRTPQVGEVWLTQDFFNPENEFRPGVVVSVEAYFQCRKDVVLLPISSKVERARCETDCVLHDWREAGLAKPSYVKCNPVTVKDAMLEQRVGRLTQADLEHVLNCLKKVFGF